VPGSVVLVRDRGHVDAWAAGYADVETQRKVRANDRFRVGSVTKTFVATVVLQLAAERRLRLEDSVEHWLPGLIPGGRRITVRELLSHRSGLPDVADDPLVLHGFRSAWSPRRLAAFEARQERTSPPGAAYHYSSTNYLILALIVERVTGHTLADELDRRVIEPLRLSSTTYVPGSIRSAHVHGYRLPSHQGIVDPAGALRDLEGQSAVWADGSGDLVSSARDLATFFAALLGGRLLPGAQLQAMEQLHPTYGLGLATYPTRCGRAWGHTGNLNGIVSIAWSTRDGARQVVAMANVYPMPQEAETALRRVAVTAFCEGR